MRRREFLAACGGAFGAALGGVASSLVVDGAAHPGPFRPLGRVALDGATEAVVGDDGEVAYVAVRDGYATVDVSAPDRPSILAERRDRLADRENGPLRNVQDVSVDGDRLLVAGPANPRRNALSGVLVVDVSDPADPVERAFFETDYPIHNCLLVDGLAYLTGNGASEDGNPLVVVDVAGDEPTEVGRWSLLSADDRWADVDRSLWTLHDVWVQGGIAYCAHWDAGTWLVDVRDPADPSAVGSLGTRDPAALADLSPEAARREATIPPGNHHSTATNPAGDLLAVGRETWAVDTESGLLGGPGGIDLWDVGDPATPERLATIGPPPTRDPTVGGLWTTAHNFELADGVLYAAWYQGGVSRHDVSDPATPVRQSWWRDPGAARFWTARLGVAGSETGFFVASSDGRSGTEAALYTFPDHAGEQLDPPALVDDPAEAGWADAADETPTAGPTVAGGSPSTARRDTATPAGTDTPTRASAEATDDSAGTTAARSPGLGIGAALSALGGAGWWLRRTGD